MKVRFIPVGISLWISLVSSPLVWAWGATGHKIVADFGTRMANPTSLTNCHVTVDQIIAHTNDPDSVWRNQRFKHPHEAQMHFFHVDRQPPDWRSRKNAKDPSQGLLVYHIVDWVEEAKTLRKKQKWDDLAEHLYGISHYIGDLSQPLHLNHDYDGRFEAGLPGIHSQFETKMVNRFEKEIRTNISRRVQAEKIPVLWSRIEFRELIFNTAEQSGAKAAKLFAGARQALTIPHTSRKHKNNRPPSPRFVKKDLWRGTGELAVEQLSTGARIWAKALDTICQ